MKIARKIAAAPLYFIALLALGAWFVASFAKSALDRFGGWLVDRIREIERG